MKIRVVVVILMLLAGSNLYAQKVYWGTESWVTREGSHRFRYTRALQLAKDIHGKGATSTTTFVTKYDLFDDNGRQTMSIVVEHIKKRGIVLVMMIPYTSIERDIDNMFGQEIGVDEFNGLCFTEKGIYYALGSPYVKLKMCFFSANKEHVKLMQIIDDDPTDKIHYKLEN